jgi:chromosome segregation ATPase
MCVLSAEETSPVATQELQENVQRIAQDLDTLQRELKQARDVWQAALSGDASQTRAEIDSLEERYRHQTEDQEKQLQAVNTQLTELEKFLQSLVLSAEERSKTAIATLETRLQEKTNEAVKLSMELDALRTETKPRLEQSDATIKALQREISLSQSSAAEYYAASQSERHLLQEKLTVLENTQRALESEKLQLSSALTDAQRVQQQRDALFNRQREDQHTTVLELQRANAELKQQLDDLRTSELQARQSADAAAAKLAAIEAETLRDRAIWQQSLAAKIQEMHDRDAHWATQFGKQEYVIGHLQNEAMELQRRLYALERAPEQAAKVASTLLPMIEAEISALSSVIQNLATPQRRKTDFLARV